MEAQRQEERENSPENRIDYYGGLEVLQLKPIKLATAPFNKGAIKWSCDGELAVASDNSVHLFVPQFPGNDTKKPRPTRPRNKQKTGFLDLSSDDEPEDETYDNKDDDHRNPDAEDDGSKKKDVFSFEWETNQRPQFSANALEISVSIPAADIRINAPLYYAAGLEFPYQTIIDEAEAHASSDSDDSEGTDDDDDNDEDDNEDDNEDENIDRRQPGQHTKEILTKPVGAGVAPLAADAGTMNSVVSLDWSPSGLGRNQHPVLGVLTASGNITIYGEAAAFPGRRHQYDFSAWKMLWAVGERFLVPPQKEFGEYITSFAWAREIGPGRALLAYRNDQYDIVILSVKRDEKVINDENNAEHIIWHVHEVARFDASGPHPMLTFDDPAYVPQESSFGLRWSPWLTVGSKKMAALAYVAPGYVGFRRITIAADWSGATPKLRVDSKDLDGICANLATDAFIEWEDAILTDMDRSVCRGVIATPWKARCFSVGLTDSSRIDTKTKHSLSTCPSSKLSDEDKETNPIHGLIVHPPDVSQPTSSPVYTLVRATATAKNPTWYETNAAAMAAEQGRDPPPPPQWYTSIDEKINISLPVHAFDDSDSSSESDSSDSHSSSSSSSPSPSGGGGGDIHELAAVGGQPAHEVYLNKTRLWGLAASPGGGSTAVLTTPLSALKPDRGGFYSAHSTVLFGWAARGGPAPPRAPSTHSSSLRLSTEGRMWEWMYGAGPGVPRVTASTVPGEVDVEASGRDGMRAHFESLVNVQKCVFCGKDMALWENEKQFSCADDHVYDVCGTTGIAIQAPGISRSCGVCGTLSMKVDELIKLVPDKADEIRRYSGEVCGRCGGKFID